MKKFLKNSINWLLPVFLILFVLEMIAFPVAMGITYAGRSDDPNHTLTYTPGKLEWSDVEGIDENGVAELSVFGAVYENVAASDNSAVVAPGTEGYNIVRLKNESEGEISFTAVLYEIKSDSALPVKVSLADPKEGEFTDTQALSLPEGVGKENVVRTVTGKVSKAQHTDLDISWLWDYEISDEADLIDVDFGNRAANGSPDDITVGLYVIVEDNGTVTPPVTGDDSNILLYAVLLVLSGAALLFLFIFRKKEEREEF